MKRFTTPSPYRILYPAALFCLAVVALSTWVASHQPWLGVTLSVDKRYPGVLVEGVQAGGPADLILSPGDSILSVSSASGPPFPIEPSDLVEDPDVFPTFQGFNTFLSRQGALSEILHQPVVELNLADGRKVKVQPSAERPPYLLPLKFWLFNAMGVTIFMIVAAVWSVRRRSTAVRMFFFSGVGLLIVAASLAIIVTREMALDPVLLRTLRDIYHIGTNTFAIFGLGLLFHYPRALAPLPFTRLVAVLVFFFALNEHFQWMDLPGHTVFVQPVIYLAIALVVSTLQWRQSKGHPVDRAALKWFMLSFMGFVGFGISIYYVPAFLTGSPTVPIAAWLGSITLTFVGLALGITRYRLFDIDRWWFGIWIWFLAGVSVLAVDAALAYYIIPRPSVSLVVSLVLVGWLYFPLRQWIWTKLYRRPKDHIEKFLPSLLTGLVDPASGKHNEWVKALKEVFLPLSARTLKGSVGGAELEAHGETMLVPALDGAETIELRFAERGGRLFSPDDKKLANTLYDIARNTEDKLTVYNRGVSEERERIMRDLHDEVGGRLLSLVHTSDSEKTALLAAGALKALRDIIHSINPVERMTIGEALASWRFELKQRCEDGGVTLHWDDETPETGRILTPRQVVNLSRALHEMSTNAFVHAAPQNIWVRWEGNRDMLIGTVSNDGDMPQGDFSHGKGILNTGRRISELGGQFQYGTQADRGVFQARISVPVVDEQ